MKRLSILESIDAVNAVVAQRRLPGAAVGDAAGVALNPSARAYAQRQGIDVITPELMQEALPGDGRSKMLGSKPLFRKQKPKHGADS